MKKLRFFIMLLILLLVPVFSAQAKKCEDYSKWNCKKIDDELNVCEMDVNGVCFTSPYNVDDTCLQITKKKSCKAKSKCYWDPDKLIGFIEIGGVCESTIKANGSYQTPTRKNGATNTPIVDGRYKCSDVKHLSEAWLLIRIAAPFIIVLFGSLDLIKSVMANDEKEMKKLKGKLIKRIIAFALLIVLPFVVQLVFSLMGTYGSDNVCLLKCITSHDTSDKGCDQ